MEDRTEEFLKLVLEDGLKLDKSDPLSEIDELLRDEEIEKYVSIHRGTKHKKSLSYCGCPMATKYREYQMRIGNIRKAVRELIEKVRIEERGK